MYSVAPTGGSKFHCAASQSTAGDFFLSVSEYTFYQGIMLQKILQRLVTLQRNISFVIRKKCGERYGTDEKITRLCMGRLASFLSAERTLS